MFSVFLPCLENSSGIARLSIGLLLQKHNGEPLPGTPLRLTLKKECAHRGERTSIATQKGNCFDYSICIMPLKTKSFHSYSFKKTNNNSFDPAMKICRSIPSILN